MDTAAWEIRLEGEWWPALRDKYEEVDHLPAPQWTPDRRRVHMIHHPAGAPEAVVRTYPAHLHLNLLPRAQGKGIGKLLLNVWLDKASELGADAVHVGVNQQNSRPFRFWPTPRKQNTRAYSPLAGSIPIDIIAVNDHRCRWPVDADKKLGLPSVWAFCGMPVAQHRYCKTHGALAYKTPPR